MFGTVQGAQLANILLRDAVVTASDNMQNIGVLVGFSSGSIENCRVEELSINVQQKQNVENAAEATATEQNVGGLVGAMQADSLSGRFTLKKKRWNWTL